MKAVKMIFGVASLILAFWAGNVVVKTYITDFSEGAREAQAVLKTPRPGFVLPDLAGVARDVNEWNGKVLILNFWATWCPPCRREMPAFVDLQAQYGTQGVQFVGIALDEAGKAQDFLDQMGVDYPNLIGGKKGEQVAIDYGDRFGALPYTAIISRDGMISATYRGELSREEAEAQIRKLL